MNEDVFAGQWKQMRGELKSWWGKLADDDLDRIGGQKDKLIGLVQEKYGYARDHAEQEVERRFKEFGSKTGGVAANMAAKAQEFGSTAANKEEFIGPHGDSVKTDTEAQKQAYQEERREHLGG